MEQTQMTKKTVFIRSIIAAFLLLSGFSASAQFDLDIGVTNACNGPNSGAIEVTILNDLVGGAFTYDWAGPNGYTNTTAVGFIATPEPGTYTMMVTRTADGAMRNATIDVLQSAIPLGFSVPIITDVGCDNGFGSIVISGDNGTAPYQYAIVDYPGVPATATDFAGFTSNDGDFTGLTLGSYSIAVRDALGCIEILDQIAVNQAANNLTLTLQNSTNAICFGANDGSITVQGQNGIGDNTYSLIRGGGAVEQDFIDQGFQANGGFFEDLAADTYDAAVRDENGCITLLNGIIVTEPDAIEITTEIRFTSCDDLSPPLVDDNGSIEILTIVGGTPPYTRQWDGPNGPLGTGFTETDLIGGEYSVTITDDNGCEAFFPFTIYEGFDLVAIPTNVSCFELDDGSIQLNIIYDGVRIPETANQEVRWFEWDGIISTPLADVDDDDLTENLGPGEYIVQVTDVLGCVKMDTVEVTAPDSRLEATVAETPNACIGDTNGIIEITAIGGGSTSYQYSLDNVNYQEESVFNNLATGMYTAYVLDENGCIFSIAAEITEPPVDFNILGVNTTNIVCFADDEIGVAELVLDLPNLNGIQDINWLNFAGDTLINSQQPVLVEQVDTLAEGAYVIAVQDIYGCVKTVDFSITRPEEFSVVLVSQDVPCPEGGNITLDVTVEGGTPNYNYVWARGSNILQTTSSTASTSDQLLLNITDPSSAGNYTVTITDANGCPVNDNDATPGDGILEFVVTIPDDIVIVADPVVNNACIGGDDGSIAISASGGTPFGVDGYTYTWFRNNVEFSNNKDISNLDAATYRVEVTDANDCLPETLEVMITDPTTTYRIDTVAINPVVCNGETTGSIDVDIVVDAGHPTLANQFTYTWYKDGAFFRPDAIDLIGNVGPGVYELVINDNYFGLGQGCEQSATFEVEEFNPIVLNPNVIDNVCPPPSPDANSASIELRPVGGLAPSGYSYSWEYNGSPFVPTPEDSLITSLEGGQYRVTVTDDLGCAVQQIFNITEFTAFSVDAVNVTPISCHDENDASIEIQDSGFNGTPQYTWTRDGSFFSSNKNIGPLDAGVYELTIVDVVTTPSQTTDCTVATITETITNPDEYFIVETITDVTCNAGSDGIISVTINQGGPAIPTGNITFRWTDEGGSPIDPGVNKTFIDNLTAGIYNLEIEDDLTGCTTAEQFEVIEYQEIFPVPTVVQLKCPGPTNHTASITVTPQGGNTSVAGSAGYMYSWTRNGMAVGGTTNTQIDLDEGTYVVTITDDSGCSVPFEQIIDPIPDYTITESVEQITCAGEIDGAINLEVTGGSGTITYQWSLNGSIISNEDSISNLEAGDYLVEVIDDLGFGQSCAAYTNTFTITDPGTYTVTPTIQAVACDAENDGVISLNITDLPSGTVGDLDFNWVRDADGFNYAINAPILNTDVGPGSYTLTISNQSFSPGITTQCERTFNFDVPAGSPITLTSTVVQNECPHENIASISIVVSGASGVPTIQWFKNDTELYATGTDVINGSEATPPLSGLATGKYTAVVTDNTTCSESISEVIQPIEPFILVTEEVTQISCIGEEDGALNVVVEGGTGDINYTWFHDGVQLEDRPDLQDLEPGEYILSVTDSKTLPTGCNAFEFLDGNLTRTYTISEPDPLVVEEVNITQVTCAGEEDGIIEVRVVDNNGIVQDPADFVMTWYSIASDNTESELPNSNVLSRGGLAAGRYRIEVNDNSLGGGSGCLYSSTFELNDNLPLEFTIATQQLSCGTATDGEIYVQNIAGGSTPYNITWRDQAGTDLGFVNQDTITGLGDGTYIATVTDANLCQVTQSGIIIIYTPINIKDFIVSDKLCSDSSPSEAAISLELEGGDGGDYIIEWTGPNGFFSDQEDISELEPGDYTVTINQTSTCDGSEVTQTFTIDEPITVTATAIVTPETCFGAGDGSITNVDIIISNQPTPAISENSFSYTWRYNGQVIGNSITPPDNEELAAGEYELEINDNTPGSCITTQTFTIEDNPAVTLTPIINQISCAGDNDASITVEALGGAPDYNYQWYQESTLPADELSGETSETLSNRGPGTYFVVVTDQSGCAKSNLDNPYVIEDIQPIEVPTENVSVTQIKCIGETNGEIAINITGGRGPFDITWQKDGEFFRRDEGVVAADTAESRITNLADGIYTVTIDENSTCPPFTASYTIDERTTTFTGGVARPQAITCFNASDGILNAVIIPDAGHPTDFEVEWYKDDATVPFSTEIEIDQLGPGTYRSEVTDAFGCMKEASVTLINPDPIFARAAVTELICNDAQTAIIQLDPVGGYGAFTTTWSEATLGVIDNPGFRLASLGAGEYTISLMDTVGCVKDTTILILNPIAINLISTVQNVDCQGSPSGSIDLNVTEGTAPYTFQWRRDSTLVSLEEDLSEIVAGNYTVRVEDSNGCVVNSDTIQVTEPEVSFTIQAEIDRVTCNNGTDGSIQPIIVEEGGTSTYRFNWYKDSVLFALDTETIVGISPGLYTVEVEDANGCVKTRNYELINPPVLDVNHVTEDLSCFRSGDGAISVQAIGGYGNYSYEWSTGGEVLPDTTSRLSNLEVGIYQCVITDVEGCDITRRFQVNQPLPIIIDFVTENNTCPGPYDAFITPTVTGGRPPYTFLWERNGEPFTDSLAIDSLPPAEYVLTVTDSSLCDVKTDPIIIEAPDPLGFNFLEFVDNLCPTTENGMISVQGIGGTSPYTFSFDSSAFNVTNDFFGLAKDKYPLSVMDDVGCVTDTIIEINHQYDLQPDFTYSFQELAIDYDISFEDQTVGPGLVRWFWDFGDERASPEQDPVTQFEAVGEYIVSLTVENEVQCVATFSDTLQVEQGYVFTIPSGFSPNNDGLNDFFRPVFDDIIDIRTNIVDRNGEIVFTSNSREEFWDGRVNGDRLPQGPYYYEISYTSRAGKTRFQKGKVLLLR